jgi:hypothetical protein
MKTRSALLGVIGTLLASAAMAQTTPSNTSPSASQSPSNSMPANSPSRMPSNGGADQSAGAKEQQSQKAPCTGNDHSNVNCKQKQGNSSSNPPSSSNPSTGNPK